ncbi:MAG TPA: isochorismatase family cysteine hydrolase [Rhizomicrobium sp.]|nr:isochorismatase family cysteine hydrolase [Rhizomicrobium sp.]
MKADWIAPKRTALLVIDCQVDFGARDGEMARRGADMTAPEAALAKAEQLVKAARAAGVAVIFVRLISNPGAESRVIHEARARQNETGPDLCVEGTHGADFIGPLPHPEEMVISKNRYSAFARTGLGDRLHSIGVDTLVLAGLTTECCVASSAWDGFELDFHVFIAADACAAYEAALHGHALKALALSGAVVAETAAFQKIWKNIAISNG